MNIAVLGNGLEGRSVANYFKSLGDNVRVFDNFTPDQIPSFHLVDYDRVFRSPSVPPSDNPKWSSSTRYFFQHCPCPIIGVTGTKGKGTTCSLIAAILESVGKNVHLLGNIGTPALDVLENIKMSNVVVYELSSFQLWDLEQSPHIAVVLRIEPDHLDIHKDFEDYLSAKSNITRHQTKDDFCIYFDANPNTKRVADQSPAKKLSYPAHENRELLDELLSHLSIPGPHNRENAEAALLAVYSYLGYDHFDHFLSDHFDDFAKALEEFDGLPHRLQYLRELNGVKYYDDNYSTVFPSLDVAIETFKDTPTILIAGGRNKGQDLSIMKDRIFSAYNIKQVILIGESAKELSEGQDPSKFQLAETLEDAVEKARLSAEQFAAGIDNCLTDDQTPHESVVVMSPGCASFDMFDSYVDRGTQFQKLINSLN